MKTERLTCKPDGLMENYYIETTEDSDVEDRVACFNKLGQLEDIEEELGIDLITLINAIRNGVYVINVDSEIIFEEPVISFNQENKTNLYVLDSVCEMPPDELCKSCNYYLKDYGKTWALTEEELK